MKNHKLDDSTSIKIEPKITIDSAIETLRNSAFKLDWGISLDSYTDKKNVRINSLVIGKVGETSDRIYVGANTNKVLVFETDGTYIDSIELGEGVEVEKLIIVDVANSTGKELLIQIGDDTVLFFNINHKGIYEELPLKIYYPTTSITALFATNLNDEYASIFIGDSNGNVLKNTYNNLKLSKEAQIIIPEADKLSGEAIASISGSSILLNNNFGLIIGYKNGLLLLMNSNFDIISKFDIDREIENIYLIEKNQSIVIITDDNNIYHFSVIDNILVNDWIYYFNSTISTIIPDSQEDTPIDFYVLSEDNGTISIFDNTGKFVLTGDPSFEGTTGYFYEQNLILASREGEISQFSIIGQEKSKELQRQIHNSYLSICQLKEGNIYFEFFNSEFESDENSDYFKLFLLNYLTNNPDKRVIDKIITLFKQKKYNTDTAEGLVRKIISDSQLKNAFLEKFDGTSASEEIINYQEQIDTKRSEINLTEHAETFLKKDDLKYIALMSELRIRKLEKKWVKNIIEDDHVVGIKYFHDPYNVQNAQILLATEKGTVLLLDKKNGQIIWSFNLDTEDGIITNIDVADICSDGIQEIVLGLENSQNSIIVLSTRKDKFNSANNEVDLKWHAENELNSCFKLYLTRCTVAGMDYEAVHKVRCFDFDHNGVQDLIISSENEKFDVFYFDQINKSRIIPKTKSIDLNEDDILVFELVRDEDNQIYLYTGSASGNINKHVYDGNDFLYTNKSFTERDAQITDILYAIIEDEKVVIFSSEDNFIYCLNSDLEYKWAFKTGGDVKSIGTTKFKNQDLIFAISDDGYLYALDAAGNNKWRYLFMAKDGGPSPLDKFLVNGDELTVADSDGSIHLLCLKDSADIDKKMDEDLIDSAFNLKTILSNPVSYVRVFAIRKLLSSNPDTETLRSIILLLNDGNESEELVRCESIKLLTDFLTEKESFIIDLSNALIETLYDYSPEVRIEGVKSFLSLIEKHKFNGIDISFHLAEITKDEDIWVKEYLAGALNNFIPMNEDSLHAKWNALSSLLKNSKNEEWILNEAANSIGSFLSNINDGESLISFISELFENDLEDETFQRIRNKISSTIISSVYNVYFQVLFGNNKKIEGANEKFVNECYINQDKLDFKCFSDKINSFITIIKQCILDDIISDKLLIDFSKHVSFKTISFANIINNLNEYERENSISGKVIFLSNACDSISTLVKGKTALNIFDKRLFELAIETHLNDLISKTSRLLREKVDLEIEMENREVILNDNGIVDINFNIINKGYNVIEEIEILVKFDKQSKFEIIQNIGEIGELIKSQSKKVYFKIKPKVFGAININFDISYNGCLLPISKSERVFIKESIKKEWMDIPNPYTSGIPVENDDIFVGRETLIKEAVTALKKDPVFIMGHRRMGKTSLIKYIQRHYLISQEYVSIFISAEKTVFSNIKDFLFSFCRPIALALKEYQIISEDQSRGYLANIRENGLIDFGVFFDDILYEIKKQNKTLVLIIDEYPIIHQAVADGKIDSEFIINLRGYMQNNSKEFKMIYSGASSLKYIKSQYSSNIMGVGKSLEVSFLDELDVRTLISKPLHDKMQFEDSAFKYLMEITFGQPFLVQVCLSFLTDKLNKERKGSIVFKDDIEEGMGYYLEQAPHLQEDWNKDVYSTDLKWNESDEKIARLYKQLIITSITDTWKKTKNGLRREELFSNIEKSLLDIHKISHPIFDEVINIMAGTDDILKKENELYFIKVGLFREWVINKMNFSYNKSLQEIKEIINN